MRKDFTLDEFFETLGKNRRKAAVKAALMDEATKFETTLESASITWNQGKIIPAPDYELPCDVEPYEATLKSA